LDSVFQAGKKRQVKKTKNQEKRKQGKKWTFWRSDMQNGQFFPRKKKKNQKMKE